MQASKIEDLQLSTTSGAQSICSFGFWFDNFSETPSRCSHKEKRLFLLARIYLGLHENTLGIGWGISTQSENPLQVFSHKHGYYSSEKCPYKGKDPLWGGCKNSLLFKTAKTECGAESQCFEKLQYVCVHMCVSSFLVSDILIQLVIYISSENINRYYMTLRMQLLILHHRYYGRTQTIKNKPNKQNLVSKTPI